MALIVWSKFSLSVAVNKIEPMEELVVKKGEEEEKMKRRKKLARKLKELVTKAQVKL